MRRSNPDELSAAVDEEAERRDEEAGGRDEEAEGRDEERSVSRRNPSAIGFVSFNFKNCCMISTSSPLFTLVHLISLPPSGSCETEKKKK